MFRIQRSNAFRILLYAMTFAFLPLSFHCSTPPEPKEPSWKTQLTIPLLQKTYYFGDMISKDPKFDTTGGTILYKPIVDEIGFRRGMPQDVFDMPSPRGNTIVKEIGVVPIGTPPSPQVTVTPAQLGLPTGTIPPLTPDPPAASISLNFGDSSVYKYLVFETGTMSMSITNNFPFAVQFGGNTLQLVNLSDTNTVVATFTFAGQIAPGATANSNVVSLADKKMDAGLKLKGTLQVIGWAGTTIQSSNNLTAQMSISNAEVKTALAKTNDFDDQSVFTVSDSSVVLDDSIKVKFATFESGGMQVRIINTVPLKLTVQFKIDELIDNATGKAYALPGTDPITGVVTIDPKDSLVTTIDMANMTFTSRLRNISNDTLVTQELHFTLGIKTLTASTDYELVNKTDYVIADVQPVQSFVLQEVQGKVPPQSIAINQELDAGIGDIGNKLTLDAFNSNIQLSAQILSTGLFPTNLVVNVIALDKNGNRGASVLIRNQSEKDSNTPYHRIVPGALDVVPIPSADINVLMNSFLATQHELPSKFLMEGYALVSPMDVYTDPSTVFGVGIGGVKQTDSIFVNLDYAIPVAIGIQNAVLRDTVSISANVPDTAQVNLIEEGKVFFDLTSTFPVGIEVRTKLLKADPNDSSKASTTDPPVLLLDTLTIQGSTDHSNRSSFTFMSLSGEEASKLNQASFTAIDLNFETTVNGGVTPVTFGRRDSLVMKTSANIRFNVDLDRLK